MSRWMRADRPGTAVYVSALLALGLLTGSGRAQNQAIVPADGASAPAAVPANTPQAGAPPVQTPTAPAAAERPAGGVAPIAPSVTPGVSAGSANQGGPTGAPATQALVPAASAPASTAAETPAAPAAAASVPATAVAPTETTEAATSTAKALPKDGNAYPVTEIKIGYKFPHPALPAISDLLNTEIKLGMVEDGYVAPRPGIPTATIKLGDIGKLPPQKIYRSGIAAIYGHILKYFSARNIIGVFVVVDPADIETAPRAAGADPNVDRDKDVRNGRTSLQFVVVTSTVKQVRTVEVGDEGGVNRVNNPRYDPIRKNSPLQPAPTLSIAPVTSTEPATTSSSQPASEPASQPVAQGDLLRKDVLDDYRLRLNRIQGRRVDVAISGTDEAGQVYLDYLISEARPWYAYAQVSNTGTSQTADWRERFGFVDNQLTGHDDTLTLDYSTAGFTKSQEIIGSYELPFFSFDRLRYRVYASWNQFTASDVGLSNQRFSGDQWIAGNEMSLNFFQEHALFVDAVGGFRFQDVETTNQTGSQEQGKGNFFVPYVGMKMERITDIAATTGMINLVTYTTNTRHQEVEALGRLKPSFTPMVFQYDFAQSFYLEPLLDPQHFAAGSSTLAHEMLLTLRGQWTFNKRMFPEAEDVAGGLFSVRGYPESIAAGDNTVIGTVEYRFHVPRVFGVVEDPTKNHFLWFQGFRYQPQQTYGKPDWDFILRTFVDAADVVNAQRQTAFENDAALVGVGVGAELQIKQNFNLRVDLGVPLTSIMHPGSSTQEDVTAGDVRVHITSTILY